MLRKVAALTLGLLSVVHCEEVVASNVAEEEETPSKVIKLTEATFEHDTQAASGATTGDWLVNFHSPWCGHCKKLAPTWKELADALDGQVNVASVDCTESRAVCNRFNIRGYPTIALFKRGKMYKNNSDRQLNVLVKWAKETYATSTAEDVPRVPTRMDKVKDIVTKRFNDIKKMYYAHPDASALIGGAGFLIGVVVGVVMRELGARRKAANAAKLSKSD